MKHYKLGFQITLLLSSLTEALRLGPCFEFDGHSATESLSEFVEVSGFET